MPYTVHQITPANAALLRRVDPDVFDHPIDPAYLAAYLGDPRHALFVAVADGQVVGQIRGNVHLQPDRAADLYVDNLGTAPSWQRRGIASALMQAMLGWGKALGCTFAWVATETDNEAAQGFYAAQSFSHDTFALFARDLT